VTKKSSFLILSPNSLVCRPFRSIAVSSFSFVQDNARFLLVKLLLRKQDTWHRLDTLKYQDELGSVSAIVDAINELCQVSPESLNDVEEEEEEEQEVIDLTMDDNSDTFSAMDDKQEGDQLALMDTDCPVEAGPSGTSSEPRILPLAWSEGEMDLETLLYCLRIDELKVIAKQMLHKTNHKVSQDLSCVMTSLLDSLLLERRLHQSAPPSVILTADTTELCTNEQLRKVQR
jgi:Fanconi-associated nuclease 1